MASLIFAHSKSIVNKAKKAASKHADMIESMGGDPKDAYNTHYKMIINSEMSNFDEYLKVSSMLHNRYMETMQQPQHYFITIRPDDTKCTFIEFKHKVEQFIKRKCFMSYTLSYEQKGTCPTELGNGFHVHIVSQMRQRSKAEVLRDTLSSWNDWIEKDYIKSNCIQVLTTKNPTQIVNDYLIEYKSDDEHKEITKEMDMIWRRDNELANIYYSE